MHEIFVFESANHFGICFTMYTKMKMSTIEIEDGREAP